MMAQVNPAVASDLQQLRERFEDWRRTRARKSPIPEPLWAAAAKLARSSPAACLRSVAGGDLDSAF